MSEAQAGYEQLSFDDIAWPVAITDLATGWAVPHISSDPLVLGLDVAA